jgi:exopolysaccharide production protein ExoZ
LTDTSKQVFGSLEIGRFLAASIVVLTHFTGELRLYALAHTTHLPSPMSLPAPFAVQFFFVLSGFVMMTAHRGDFGRLAAAPKFCWRRACRIFPMYWLALAIVILTLHPTLPPQHLWALISLAPHTTQELVSPAWSLRYEVAFYIAFGLCLLPYIGRILLVSWVVSVLWLWRPAGWFFFLLNPLTLWLTHFSAHNPAFFTPFEFLFFMGLAAGLFRPSHRGAGWAFLLAGITILLSLGPWYDWGRNYGVPALHLATGFGFATLILGCATLERSGAWHLGPWARKLGAISYPLYILHTAIITLVWHISHNRWQFHGANLYLFGTLYLTAIYTLSALAAFCIDKPLQRGLRRITQAGTAALSARFTHFTLRISARERAKQV